MPYQKISEAEAATAQYMAQVVSHTLGNAAAARSMKLNPSLLWQWKMGKCSPTKANFRRLQVAYEALKPKV